MKINNKWALALVPLVLAGCKDDIEQPRGSVAESGDDVRFMISNDLQSRTMYAEPWLENATNEIYWGNYVSDESEEVNIYCPDNPGRGFARYKITPKTETEQDRNHAAAIVKLSDIGVQWGESGKPYHFYSFYPADKAGTELKNGNTISVTVETGQSPRKYKKKVGADGEIVDLESFKTYIDDNYTAPAVGDNKGTVKIETPTTLYGMPDMRAAVMMASTTMAESDFGKDVPLRYNVLADVLDITLNGPITPNQLGGNGDDSKNERDFIQIQSVTVEAVKVPTDPDDKTEVKDYEIDDALPISGTFDLNMTQGLEIADRVSNVQGSSTVQLQLSMSNADGGVYYPTLFVRPGSTLDADGKLPQGKDVLDHLRVRAFLIPGQITGDNLNQLRIHIQTNYGEYYQMLQSDSEFITGNIYPVKCGYFKVKGADFDLSKWVGQLNPKIYISELSIPGAWHAANDLYQSVTDMSKLYEAGIRAFEVHTKNGKDLMKYGSFGTPFDITTEKENFEEPFIKNQKLNQYSYTDLDLANVKSNGGWTQTSITIDGTTYNRRREVETTATVTYLVSDDGTPLKYTVPKFWLRLYRTNNTGTGLSDAIITLAKNLRSDGLMFIEIGAEGEDGMDIPYRSLTFTGKKYVQSNVTIKGYEGGSYSLWSGTTASGKYEWDPSTVTFTVTPQTGEITDDESGYFKIDGREAWAIAVRSCLERLAATNNTAEGNSKPILYSGTLDRFTTIEQVQGQIIAKVNTNPLDTSNGKYDSNEFSWTWGSNTPALFSRWIGTSGDTPQTINLSWKSPVAPYDNGDTGVPNTELRWCFTELDNITDLAKRKEAITMMNTTAATNYGEGLHRTFYETSLGGFDNYTSYQVTPTVTAAKCQNVAAALNPFALARITNPSRQAVPLGLVFMNYCIDPNNLYQSEDLIRAIINNNRAFLLNRADANESKPAAGDNTNSYFNNNNQNPLK